MGQAAASTTKVSGRRTAKLADCPLVRIVGPLEAQMADFVHETALSYKNGHGKIVLPAPAFRRVRYACSDGGRIRNLRARASEILQVVKEFS